MLPTATIAHAMAGRARFRIPARKGDADYFARIEQTLVTCDGVHHVVANPLTASVLVQHETDVLHLMRCARDQHLFAVREPRLTKGAVMEEVATRIEEADALVRRTTRGAFDLEGIAFVGLLGAAAVQLMRGRILGPATSLIASAIAIMEAHEARRVDTAPPHGEPEEPDGYG